MQIPTCQGDKLGHKIHYKTEILQTKDHLDVREPLITLVSNHSMLSYSFGWHNTEGDTVTLGENLSDVFHTHTKGENES